MMQFIKYKHLTLNLIKSPNAKILFKNMTTIIDQQNKKVIIFGLQHFRRIIFKMLQDLYPKYADKYLMIFTEEVCSDSVDAENVEKFTQELLQGVKIGEIRWEDLTELIEQCIHFAMVMLAHLSLKNK